MPRDLVLTWPKKTPLRTYLSILSQAYDKGLVINFRVGVPPAQEVVAEVERVYMVHDGKIRGWNPFEAVEYRPAGIVRDRAGGFWPEGWYIVRKPVWHPLRERELVPMTGFQGFRYIERKRDWT